MNNLLTDIAGVRVGHADDARLGSGVTAVVFDRPAVAAMDVRGGGPGTREGALLDPANTVERIDAIALAGGSAFGLDAGAGIQGWLAEHGRGFELRGAIIPIVPGAIFFDLLNGGNKKWGRFSPYRDLGYIAAAAASTSFALGSVGAGLGANTDSGASAYSAKPPFNARLSPYTASPRRSPVTPGPTSSTTPAMSDPSVRRAGERRPPIRA